MTSNGQLSKLVKQAKSTRQNRVYYGHYFDIGDIREAGIVQAPEKTVLDSVQLNEDRNERLHLFGVDPTGSSFDLRLTVVSLYPNGPEKSESPLRLGTLDFVLRLRGNKSDQFEEYYYNTEQLLDYSVRRRNRSRHECRNIYHLGSFSIETVLPYSLTRVLFNGLLKRRGATSSAGVPDLVPVRLSISTHPTCDKFDFKYLFDKKHTAKVLEKSLDATRTGGQDEARRLLELYLEDCIEQPMMFHGHLRNLGLTGTNNEQKFTMWGIKTKKFLRAKQELVGLAKDERREHLFAWAECGIQIHLTRPVARLDLINGLVHNNFDYASYLYDCSITKSGQRQSGNSLEPFGQLSTEHKISLKGFKMKQYKLELSESVCGRNPSRPFQIRINSFDGWALVFEENLGETIREAQAKLWQMQIIDRSMSFQLANERLLGGKANSLIQLSRVSSNELTSLTSVTLGSSQRGLVKVSVPRGLVITCQAYRVWAQSEPKVKQSISKLDCLRRSLAAKSVHVDPLSNEHVPLASSQMQLRNQCDETNKVLLGCELPLTLRDQVRRELVTIFGQDELESDGGKKFAIRSSAVGEDSLETSAAGQMKTILGAQGFDNICKSIVECWASQFELEAVSYKSQNGLEFDLPMSVVVQELIQCEVAGVAATCNPLSGNRLQLEITANRGLGEGVVAGGRTDTVRVDLSRASLHWDDQLEEHCGELQLNSCNDYIEKLPAEAELGCCLSDAQIVALANLLLQLRRRSGSIREREVEWGITSTSSESTNSGSSSSSSDSSRHADHKSPGFQIHLLQSRPLTNLQRLDTTEIDHELDSGFSAPLDNLSRANLGEVMPGALSATNISYFQPVATSYGSSKPYEKNHTRKVYAADSFGFYCNIAVMVISYTDTIQRLMNRNMTDEQRALSRLAIRMMIGTDEGEIKDKQQLEQIERFHVEKVNPLTGYVKRGAVLLLSNELGLYRVFRAQFKYKLSTTKLADDLTPMGQMIERLNETQADMMNDFSASVEQQIALVWERLCSETKLLAYGWRCHIMATLTSMGLNMICLSLMGAQPVYPDKLDSKEILNDFSTMMRQPLNHDQLGKQTESGDISKLLGHLVDLIDSGGEREQARGMSHKQLYDYLHDSSTPASQLFRDFMSRNAHRAYKEFCMSTETWGDDCSYIIRSLSMRLKQKATSDDNKQSDSRQQVEEHARQVAQIEAKFERNKFLLSKVLFPRARHGTVRREQSKSMLMKALHRYRLAFRHLGGLLCLAGRLPSADLVFWLAIEELDQIVNYRAFGLESCHQDLPRFIYKARRRQQRARRMQTVNFPHPTMRFHDIIGNIEAQLNDATTPNCAPNGLAPAGGSSSDNKPRVRGLTSCAGKVTGRACVVLTLDEMEQMQPNDILVTYSIDISWSVYFFALSGIVTELGGIISHGAVVAREYGIPTLCTALGACSIFTTGQMITLDADNGICYLADDDN